jgi:dienelactone hydrolase
MARMRHLVIATLMILASAPAHAQAARFAYPAPAAGVVSVTRDVPYGASGADSLRMDVYRPASAGDARPALIFFNVASGADRGTAFYASWAQIAASNGLVAILPDLRDGSAPKDFQALVDHLVQHAASLGIDREAIAVYAGSGNVYTAFPILEDPKQTAIKAAVMFYGSAPVAEFRLDLPVLYVRAGLDRPGVNRDITTLAALAVSQNAPVTLVNHPTGHHGFEMFDDDDATRQVMDRMIAFVKQATTPSYQSALRRGLPEAVAAGQVLSGRFREAVDSYASLVAARPDDARMRLAYGEALLGDKQYGAACAALEPLKGKGLGPRDLGVPAARACAQKGDGEAAMAWLRSIPSQYLPKSLLSDPALTTLAGRADFQALFTAR